MTRARTVLVLILLAAAAVVFAPTAALAAPPAVGTLSPPPEAFQTCTATGAGTTCRGSITVTYDPEFTGISCGVGSSAFDVYDVGTFESTVTSFYDTSGNLTRRIDHFKETDGRWINLTNGASVGYTQNNIYTDVLAVPGDLATRTSTTTGEIVMRPDHGAPVLLAVGRQVFGSDGELLSSAGPNAFVDGDPAAFDAMCAVLA